MYGKHMGEQGRRKRKYIPKTAPKDQFGSQIPQSECVSTKNDEKCIGHPGTSKLGPYSPVTFPVYGIDYYQTPIIITRKNMIPQTII